MKQFLFVIAVSAFFVCTQTSSADDGPLYSLDSMQTHPYRFLPAYGHASQNPGAPKYFVPGYGYRIPGFGVSQLRYGGLSPYRTFYQNGNRRSLSFSRDTYRYETNSTGGPWFYPGWSGNTQFRDFSW